MMHTQIPKPIDIDNKPPVEQPWDDLQDVADVITFMTEEFPVVTTHPDAQAFSVLLLRVDKNTFRTLMLTKIRHDEYRGLLISLAENFLAAFDENQSTQELQEILVDLRRRRQFSWDDPEYYQQTVTKMIALMENIETALKPTNAICFGVARVFEEQLRRRYEVADAQTLVEEYESEFLPFVGAIEKELVEIDWKIEAMKTLYFFCDQTKETGTPSGQMIQQELQRLQEMKLISNVLQSGDGKSSQQNRLIKLPSNINQWRASERLTNKIPQRSLDKENNLSSTNTPPSPLGKRKREENRKRKTKKKLNFDDVL